MAQKNVILVLYIALTCALFSNTNTFSLPMIPIDSPHLQMFPQKLTTQQRLELLMNITMTRASLYSTKSSRLESNSSVSINSIESGLYLMPSNYYTTQVFFGADNKLLSAYVLLDSGSRNTWVQCEGCNPCFELKSGNIPMLDSINYKFLSKDDPRCNPQLIVDNKWCGFQKSYGGGASSIGIMGTDTFFFLNSTTRRPEFFEDVAYGCGLQNHNVDFGLNTGPNNIIAGIFGIAPGPQSFLNQLDGVMKGRFSYCLTSWNEANQGMSTMHFGDSAQVGTGSNVRSIKMNSDELYHLYFRGISVDGNRLPNVDASICPLDAAIPEGFFIDSGSPSTILPQSAYQTLRDAITAFLDRYGWLKNKEMYYDLCYTLPPGQTMDDVQFPNVVFHFENGDGTGSEVDWVMPRDNLFAKFDSIKGFCLTVSAFPSNNKLCLLGAYQHANFLVLYDVRNSILAFKPQRCQENI